MSTPEKPHKWPSKTPQELTGELQKLDALPDADKLAFLREEPEDSDLTELKGFFKDVFKPVGEPEPMGIRSHMEDGFKPTKIVETPKVIGNRDFVKEGLQPKKRAGATSEEASEEELSKEVELPTLKDDIKGVKGFFKDIFSPINPGEEEEDLPTQNDTQASSQTIKPTKPENSPVDNLPEQTKQTPNKSPLAPSVSAAFPEVKPVAAPVAPKPTKPKSTAKSQSVVKTGPGKGKESGKRKRSFTQEAGLVGLKGAEKMLGLKFFSTSWDYLKTRKQVNKNVDSLQNEKLNNKTDATAETMISDLLESRAQHFSGAGKLGRSMAEKMGMTGESKYAQRLDELKDYAKTLDKNNPEQAEKRKMIARVLSDNRLKKEEIRAKVGKSISNEKWVKLREVGKEAVYSGLTAAGVWTGLAAGAASGGMLPALGTIFTYSSARIASTAVFDTWQTKAAGKSLREGMGKMFRDMDNPNKTKLQRASAAATFLRYAGLGGGALGEMLDFASKFEMPEMAHALSGEAPTMPDGTLSSEQPVPVIDGMEGYKSPLDKIMGDDIVPQDSMENIKEMAPTTYTVESGDGGIKALFNLRKQLEIQYDGVATENMPEAVQKLLGYETAEVAAIDLGFYNPDGVNIDGKESFMLHPDDKFIVNEKGLTFDPADGKEQVLLNDGPLDNDVTTNKVTGEMFDQNIETPRYGEELVCNPEFAVPTQEHLDKGYGFFNETDDRFYYYNHAGYPNGNPYGLNHQSVGVHQAEATIPVVVSEAIAQPVQPGQVISEDVLNPVQKAFKQIIPENLETTTTPGQYALEGTHERQMAEAAAERAAATEAAARRAATAEQVKSQISERFTQSRNVAGGWADTLAPYGERAISEAEKIFNNFGITENQDKAFMSSISQESQADVLAKALSGKGQVLNEILPKGLFDQFGDFKAIDPSSTQPAIGFMSGNQIFKLSFMPTNASAEGFAPMVSKVVENPDGTLGSIKMRTFDGGDPNKFMKALDFIAAETTKGGGIA